jgi:hypothetical protein
VRRRVSAEAADMGRASPGTAGAGATGAPPNTVAVVGIETGATARVAARSSGSMSVDLRAGLG